MVASVCLYIGVKGKSRLARAVRTADNTCNDVLIFISKMIEMSMLSKTASVVTQKAERQTYVRGRYIRADEKAATAAANGASTPVATATDTPAAVATSTPTPAATTVATTTTGSTPVAVDGKEVIDEANMFIGFARIFAGTLSVEAGKDGRKSTLHVFGPKYNPHDPSTYIHATTLPYVLSFLSTICDCNNNIH
jgi:hypothetical protein